YWIKIESDIDRIESEKSEFGIQLDLLGKWQLILFVCEKFDYLVYLKLVHFSHVGFSLKIFC
ncbi:hypothetical protein KKA14_00395, partial [bacterium]|nr:hypothetical protein [bacterium]